MIMMMLLILKIHYVIIISISQIIFIKSDSSRVVLLSCQVFISKIFVVKDLISSFYSLRKPLLRS